MAIETKCPTCERTLRVGDEHAGKQARCPMCNTIYVVPGGTATEPSPAAPRDLWHMRTPEGQVYGPVSHAELEGWLAEGRISAECELRTGENQAWRPADEVFGVLSPRVESRAPAPVQPHAAQNPFAGDPASDRPFGGRSQSNAGAGGQTPFGTRRFQVPHRGGMILVFGILGWIFTCPVFSVMAWVMGTSDLREMRTGRMDSSGMGLTQAGHILGMIYTLLWLIVCVIGVFFMFLAIAAEAF
jgi:hypothetical protein